MNMGATKWQDLREKMAKMGFEDVESSDDWELVLRLVEEMDVLQREYERQEKALAELMARIELQIAGTKGALPWLEDWRDLTMDGLGVVA